MDDDHSTGEVRPVILRDVLDATETRGASVGMRLRAARRPALCHRSLADHLGTADPQRPEPPNGKSRLRDHMSNAFIWMLAPQVKTDDPNIAYYYEYESSLAEYTRAFAALGVAWQWCPVTLTSFPRSPATSRTAAAECYAATSISLPVDRTS
jgi:hypothetical protein